MATIAEFLISRLENIGLGHIFGVPGDYILKFYDQLSKSNIDVVTTTDESHAGFAADFYGRVHGVGCVCVTYNVGTLKLANAVAGAYAEKSPLIIISGSPGIKEREGEALLHHMVRSFNCQTDIFKHITCAGTILDNPDMAGFEIDRVLEALKYYKQPVFIELPRDIADKPISYDVFGVGTPKAFKSNEDNLKEAIEEVSWWLDTAKRPAILAGVEMARFDLGKPLMKLAERLNVPIATTLLSKSVVDETHPLFAGVYAGASSQQGVQEIIENSDCLLMLGVILTDMTLNFAPRKFSNNQTVMCKSDKVHVKHHTYDRVSLPDFFKALSKMALQTHDDPIILHDKKVKKFVPTKNKITTSRFFEKVNSILTKDMAIITDVGDCLFGSVDLLVHEKNQFIAPAFYTSMGPAIPGALGVQLSKPHLRPIVLVGDGAFQMSCLELSTILDRGLNPIVCVINNQGYLTERLILDGKFNDLRNWNYEQIIQLIGGGVGYRAETEEELDLAMNDAIDSKKLTIINVVVDKYSTSDALKRITTGLAKNV